MEMTAPWRAMKTDGDKAILQKDICKVHHPGFKLKSEKSSEKAKRTSSEGESSFHNKESASVLSAP